MLNYLQPTPIQCPETDEDAFEGELVYSSRLYIPYELSEQYTQLIDQRGVVIPKLLYDPRRMIRGSDGKIIKGDDGKPLRHGEAPNKPINLIQEHAHHISLPRESVPEILAERDYQRIDVGQHAEDVDFGSIIRARDANQREAFDVLRGARKGTSWQACGKGKTICGLDKIAHTGKPAVINVCNGGIAWQWKKRILAFFNVEEDEIGFIQGNMGSDPYAWVPHTETELVEQLGLIDRHMLAVRRRLAKFGIPNISVSNTRHMVEVFLTNIGKPYRSVAPSGKPTVRLADIKHWAAGGLQTAVNVLELRSLKMRRKTVMRSIGGKKPDWLRKVVIVMLPTLFGQLDQLPMFVRQRFGTAVYDEAHHLPAATFSQTASTFFCDRFALTATPHREDETDCVMTAHTGDIIYKDIVPDDPAAVYVKGLPTELDMSDPEVVEAVTMRGGRMSASLLTKHLAYDVDRNWRIITDVITALKKGRRILVLTRAKAHPGILREDLIARTGNEFTSCKMNGDTDPSLRTGMIAANQVTFGTIGIAAEGLDAPSLDTIFFGSPFAGWATFVQGKGRAERLFDGKRPPIVVIYLDPNIGLANGMNQGLLSKLRKNGIRYEG